MIDSSSRPSNGVYSKAALSFYVLILSLTLLAPISDPDLWWHLTVGRWIVSHGALPEFDQWNLNSAHKPWIAYSWSNELVYAAVFDSFGAWGLIGLTFILALLLVAALCYCFSRCARNALIGSVVGAVVIAALHSLFGLRPQSFSWVVFACAIAVAERIRSEQMVRIQWGLALVALMSLWANTHLSTVIGIVVTTGWVLDLKRLRSSAKDAFTVLGTGFLGSLLTPYFGKEWLTVVAKADHPLQFPFIAEFQSLPLLAPPTAPLLLLALSALSASILTRRIYRELAVQLILVALVMFAFRFLKFVPPAAILAGALTARGLGDLGAVAGTRVANTLAATRRISTMFVVISFGGALILCLLRLGLSPLPIDNARVPVEAVDYLLAHPLPRPLLNSFGEGGYLIYRLSDQQGVASERVLFDGRTNVSDPELLALYSRAVLKPELWRELLARVEPKTVFFQNQLPLTSQLRDDPNWCRVFYQQIPRTPAGGWSIFVRKNAALESGELSCR